MVQIPQGSELQGWLTLHNINSRQIDHSTCSGVFHYFVSTTMMLNRYKRVFLSNKV